MKAASKQNALLGISIFLVFLSTGFSFNSGVQWFWQKAPYLALLFIVTGFVLIRWWMLLELQKQREAIMEAMQHPHKKNWNDLLSVREREVMQLIASGKTNQQIADELFVALSTVKTHINNIYKILEVKNRREAIEKVTPKNK
ncbi:LuxR C-terminal-related transcriptional regulator [uncultured Microscilla sp.]|uniref:helix-turn-helix domain-containing protein n=1 Tax=uncultured Microscilla sp. TaxID=432653 RepID=UPI00262F89D7|nr:LuxR C-terminal-related transcriptional regulator [uncultured Microscilla sp.]